jgi:hypothetical protein
LENREIGKKIANVAREKAKEFDLNINIKKLKEYTG